MMLKIDPHFISKEAFLKTYPTLYYGDAGEWYVVMTPDQKICALGLASFPHPQSLLRRYAKHHLVKKAIALQNRMACILAGTPFQHQVWQVLMDISRGATVTYQDIAHRLGRPKAVRAVGSAVGANPISPLIPCHRVVGSNGSLGGYYWGIEAKINLLKKEGVNLSSFKKRK